MGYMGHLLLLICHASDEWIFHEFKSHLLGCEAFRCCDFIQEQELVDELLLERGQSDLEQT